MLDPLKKIMAEYKSLFVIMQVDQISTQMAKVNVIKISIISGLLCDFSFCFLFLVFLLLSLLSFMSGFMRGMLLDNWSYCEQWATRNSSYKILCYQVMM